MDRTSQATHVCVAVVNLLELLCPADKLLVQVVLTAEAVVCVVLGMTMPPAAAACGLLTGISLLFGATCIAEHGMVISMLSMSCRLFHGSLIIKQTSPCLAL
jgi:hypothetical protein